MLYILIQPTMLFLLFLITTVSGYRKKIENKFLKSNIKFQDDD